jgi:hypothetical protein
MNIEAFEYGLCMLSGRRYKNEPFQKEYLEGRAHTQLVISTVTQIHPISISNLGLDLNGKLSSHLADIRCLQQ